MPTFLSRKNPALKLLITLSVLLHLLGNFWHGDAHTILEINLPDTKMLFVVLVILVSPVVGALLTWTHHQVLGCWVAGISLAASVVFSVFHHYVMISIDNVEHLPPGTPEAHDHFSNSAEFIALIALLGAFLSFYAAGKFSAPDLVSHDEPDQPH